MLEERYPNPKEMQINLTGFLERNARKFMPRLWDMLLSACNNPTGNVVRWTAVDCSGMHGMQWTGM